MQGSLGVIEDKLVEEHHVSHHIKGRKAGATLVFFAGVHGNELAGVKGLNNVFKSLKQTDIKGEIFGIYGNINAINHNERFIEKDLNRVWTVKNLDILSKAQNPMNEDKEQKDLLKCINGIITKTRGPLYFIDLHTTSSQSLPFITINDTLMNRKFSESFPVPIVLGIEEYLDGTLLSYLNTKGFVSIGFEAGQHADPLAVRNCEAFISLACFVSGVLTKVPNSNILKHKKHLKSSSENISAFFEIVFKYHIQPNENFKMKEGYMSFETIKKGELLAYSNEKPIHSKDNAKIFMPLYQKSGEDGFFIIRYVPRFFLWLSKLLRRLNADVLLTWLPGISWHDKKNGVLTANLKTTGFMAKEIFHLFGYRRQIVDENHALLYNRERVSKNRMYTKEPWY